MHKKRISMRRQIRALHKRIGYPYRVARLLKRRGRRSRRFRR